jgi:LAO/AO transport system kinase
MVDFFLVLLSSAAGDELQGIKRGVMELADGILVHKADGDLAAAAERAAQQCLLAMRILHAGEPDPPPVVIGSSLTGAGLDDLWRAIENRTSRARADGSFAARRTRQAGDWLEQTVRERLLADFLDDAKIAAAMQQAKDDVARGTRLPGEAARSLLAMRTSP